jgi:hypothetical protein
VALIGCMSFSSIAGANTYQLSGPIVQRPAPTPGNFDYGYRGPRFIVTGGGHTSVDTYVCPSGQSISNWVVVGDVPDSVDRDFTAWSTGSGNQINVHVTDWSWTTVTLRLAGSCTTAPLEFPYPPPNCGDFSCPYPPGDFQPYWDSNFGPGGPGVAQYAQLIQRAFCWSSSYPGCGQGAPNPTRRFALHNGINKISTAFRSPTLKRPPAVRLAGASGCAARRAHVAVRNRSGRIDLTLRCHGLKPGAKARLRIGKPVLRSFRLHDGSGSIRVTLAKPPGKIKPDVSLDCRTNKPRGHLSGRVHLHSRTFTLRVTAKCGSAAGNSVAHLYIGGLLG